VRDGVEDNADFISGKAKYFQQGLLNCPNELNGLAKSVFPRGRFGPQRCAAGSRIGTLIAH
jgi:hypothetical protein